MSRFHRCEIEPKRWNDFVFNHPRGWFFQTTYWLDYALAYANRSADGSEAFLDSSDEIVFLRPGVFSVDGKPTFGGQTTAEPLVGRNGFAAPTRWDPNYAQTYRPGSDLTHEIPSGATLSVDLTYVVDLSLSEADRWQRVRKSYRSIINKAERDYVIGTTVGYAEIALARRVHIAAARRETRPLSTWEHMGRWLDLGFAVLALASSDDECIGFAYAIRWKNWAYYMSGASLFPNVQHALQWAMMRRLAEDGKTEYYEIGHGAPETASEKERGIAHFKAGFGGSEWPVLTLKGRACE